MSCPLTREQQALVEAHLGLAALFAADVLAPGRTSDWDDARQTAWLALCRAAQTYDPRRGPFSAYARTACRRAVLRQRTSWLRIRARHVDDWDRVPGATSETWPQDDRLNQLRGQLRAAIAELSPGLRQGIEDRLAGLSNAEAARRRGITTAGAMHRAVRATAVLRERLTGSPAVLPGMGSSGCS